MTDGKDLEKEAAQLENLKISNDEGTDDKRENGIDDHSNNEDKKIFVGGISAETNQEDLLSHFSTFGPVNTAQVKYDRNTGRSRGFAFVEFQTTDACNKALTQREQQIKGKSVEIKPAKSRENKKVFVGGLPADFSEDKLRVHFEQYGKVDDIEWPFDRHRNVKRNFAFIVFETEEGADKASEHSKQSFGERECDVKKATPQSRRGGPMNMNMLPGPYGNSFYGPQSYGRGGGGVGRGGSRGGGMAGNFGAYGGGGAWNPAGACNDWYGAQSGYGGGYGYSQYYGGGHGSSANTDYWASSNANASAQGGGAGNQGSGGASGGYDSYGAGSAPGGRQGGGRAYQSYHN